MNDQSLKQTYLITKKISLILFFFLLQTVFLLGKQQLFDSCENNYFKKNNINKNYITTTKFSPILEKSILLSKIPSDLVIPAEFEEIQAILISWPCYAFDSSDNLVTPFTSGFGFKYKGDSAELVPIAYYRLNLVNESPLVKIYEQLTNEIQKECPIWIRIPQANDSNLLKQWFAQKNNNLYNYRFIITNEGVNSIWMRDCGPIGCYYNNLDSIAFLNFEYYPNSPIDDDLPLLISNFTNYQVINSSLELEGGNFINDGYKNVFTSSVIYEVNSDTIGKALTKKIPLNNKEVENELKSIINNNQLTIFQRLNCDGGTGHLDFYIKFLNEYTILINSYPKIYDNSEFQDYGILAKNKNIIDTIKSIFNEKYNIVEIEIPPSDDGDYNNIDCQSYSLNPRTYTNSLFVNKMLIYPKYSNEYDGWALSDKIAEEIYGELLPGYKLIGIDCRGIIRSGGAIHCLAQQIPAENPIRILHKPIDKTIPITNKIEIEAKVISNKKISDVFCYWRKKNEQIWNKFKLNSQNNKYNGTITLNDIILSDTIQYYIEAINEYGKKMTKPITAPNGFYSFSFNSTNPVVDMSAKIFPNPINENSIIFLKLNNNSFVQVEIYDCLGKRIKLLFHGYLSSNVYIKQINLNDVGIGLYYTKITSEAKQIVIPILKLD
ncbi:MAG: agmatine deiminase family protein [Candidatus Woesearchaeota archaeon]